MGCQFLLYNIILARPKLSRKLKHNNSSGLSKSKFKYVVFRIKPFTAFPSSYMNSKLLIRLLPVSTDTLEISTKHIEGEMKKAFIFFRILHKHFFILRINPIRHNAYAFHLLLHMHSFLLRIYPLLHFAYASYSSIGFLHILQLYSPKFFSLPSNYLRLPLYIVFE